MNFVLNPSLEHIALVKVGISLWKQDDVGALISKLCPTHVYSREKWKKIEERVTKKVAHLSLPKLLKEKVLGVIKPIGLELLEWMKYDHTRFYVNLPVDLCWTPQGTVDKKRTAEALVKDDNLDISTRYKLACVYYLEDDIHKLWNSVPEDLKEYRWQYSHAINVWSEIINRGTGHICFKHEFHSSALDGNKVAAKYFLQKLTPQERQKSLEEFPEDIEDNEHFSDVLCFLLPEMEEEEQKKVFKNFPIDVLYYFLQWPLQSFFIVVANCMWDFLSKDCYDEILGNIITKVMDGYKDYNYQKLFREFWQKSPSALKYSVIEKNVDSWLLECLFNFKDKENIRFILKDATLTTKSKLIYSEGICKNLICFIHENEWDFLEFCIRECLTSKSEMLKFKEEFEKCKYFQACSATEKHKWNQLFYFSDDSIYKYNKRNVEEGESSASKRFQSLQ